MTQVKQSGKVLSRRFTYFIGKMVGPILKGDRLAKIMGAMSQTQKAVSKETAFAINLVAGAGLNFGRTVFVVRQLSNVISDPKL